MENGTTNQTINNNPVDAGVVDGEKRNEEIKPARDEKGRLLPGHTANPKGRPKRKTFRDYFNEEEEADLINKVKQVLGEKPEILKMAVEQIFGKPKQPLTGGDEEDEPIKLMTLNELRKNNSNNEDSEPLPKD